MTREQYLEKKEELKQLSANIKYLKKEYKQCQREGCDRAGWSTEKGRRYSQVDADLNKSYFTYRSGHIFMSLVRGRSRIRIENNFEKQDWSNETQKRIEEGVIGLCNKYEFDVDYDEYRRILSIQPRVTVEEKIGA
jgi:hypothetical protein